MIPIWAWSHTVVLISVPFPGSVYAAFRIAQEAVTNVIRHSGAQQCWVELSQGGIAVCDDGTGPRAGPGSGRERLAKVQP